MTATIPMCARCGERPKVEDPARKTGFHPWCLECRRAASRATYYKHWTAHRARHEAYKKLNPEKFKGYRRSRTERIKEDPARLNHQRSVHRAWCKANVDKRRESEKRRHELHRERRNAEKARWERMKVAIETGKSSLVCRLHGFSLVVNGEDRFRAARLDRPIEPHERGLVHYTFDGRWFVRAAPVRGDEKLAQRLKHRERRFRFQPMMESE